MQCRPRSSLVDEPPSPPERRRAPADRDGLPRNARGPRRAQKCDELRNLLDVDETLHGDGLAHPARHGLERLTLLIGHLGDAPACHVRVHPSGADRIASDATRTQLDSGRPHQTVHASLARAVRGLSSYSELGQDAADRDESSGTAHHCDGGVEEVDRPEQVGVENLANERQPCRLAALDAFTDVHGARRSRIGDDDVEASPRAHGTLDCGTHVSMVSNVAHPMPSLSPRVGDLAHRVSEGAFVAPGQEDADAVGRKVKGDCLADALAASRDDRHLSLERPIDAHAAPASTLTEHPAPTMTNGPMTEDPRTPETAMVERARLRGRRWAHVLVIGVAAAFIASSGWQIASAVFGLGVVPVAEPWRASSATDRACASGLQSLAAALDRAAARCSATDEATAEQAAAVFRRALSPEWDAASSVSTACAASREGLDAWAALERLKIAEEQVARRIHAELEPLRRDLATHLPQDLR